MCRFYCLNGVLVNSNLVKTYNKIAIYKKQIISYSLCYNPFGNNIHNTSMSNVETLAVQNAATLEELRWVESQIPVAMALINDREHPPLVSFSDNARERISVLQRPDFGTENLFRSEIQAILVEDALHLREALNQNQGGAQNNESMRYRLFSMAQGLTARFKLHLETKEARPFAQKEWVKQQIENGFVSTPSSEHIIYQMMDIYKNNQVGGAVLVSRPGLGKSAITKEFFRRLGFEAGLIQMGFNSSAESLVGDAAVTVAYEESKELASKSAEDKVESTGKQEDDSKFISPTLVPGSILQKWLKGKQAILDELDKIGIYGFDGLHTLLSSLKGDELTVAGNEINIPLWAKVFATSNKKGSQIIDEAEDKDLVAPIFDRFTEIELADEIQLEDAVLLARVWLSNSEGELLVSERDQAELMYLITEVMPKLQKNSADVKKKFSIRGFGDMCKALVVNESGESYRSEMTPYQALRHAIEAREYMTKKGIDNFFRSGFDDSLLRIYPDFDASAPPELSQETSITGPLVDAAAYAMQMTHNVIKNPGIPLIYLGKDITGVISREEIQNVYIDRQANTATVGSHINPFGKSTIVREGDFSGQHNSSSEYIITEDSKKVPFVTHEFAASHKVDNPILSSSNGRHVVFQKLDSGGEVASHELRDIVTGSTSEVSGTPIYLSKDGKTVVSYTDTQILYSGGQDYSFTHEAGIESAEYLEGSKIFVIEDSHNVTVYSLNYHTRPVKVIKKSPAFSLCKISPTMFGIAFDNVIKEAYDTVAR